MGQKCVQWFLQHLNQPIIILIGFFFDFLFEMKNYTNEVPTISGKGRNTYIFTRKLWCEKSSINDTIIYIYIFISPYDLSYKKYKVFYIKSHRY